MMLGDATNGVNQQLYPVTSVDDLVSSSSEQFLAHTCVHAVANDLRRRFLATAAGDLFEWITLPRHPEDHHISRSTSDFRIDRASWRLFDDLHINLTRKRDSQGVPQVVIVSRDADPDHRRRSPKSADAGGSSPKVPTFNEGKFIFALVTIGGAPAAPHPGAAPGVKWQDSVGDKSRLAPVRRHDPHSVHVVLSPSLLC